MTHNSHDLALILNSHIPVIVIESHDEQRVLNMLMQHSVKLAKSVFKWTITEGLERIDIDLAPQRHNTQPTDVLRHIKAAKQNAIYVLADFHPYLDDAMHVRLLKDIALSHHETGTHIVLISHDIDIPPELKKLAAQFELAMPDSAELETLIHDTANEWAKHNPGKKVHTDRKTLDAMIKNLTGLTRRDAQRLIRNAIYDDGALTQTDLPEVMRTKYELLNNEGQLAFEYETAGFADVGGLTQFSNWLKHRRGVFHGEITTSGLDIPKGVLLLGVQGCGKSLAARAVAGIWNVPLLRLDFGALYNKFHGESERNLRESLKTAEVMAPCVLWMDEIEKGLAVGDNDGGTSRRMLGTLLTWMSEKQTSVFIVATANDIERLPPELIRKGRFDEIFFVDLPKAAVRETIFQIHLQKRELDPEEFDLTQLVSASEGFSGAEIEQAIVAGLYSSHAASKPLDTEHLLAEINTTKPLSVLMSEKITALRQWATDRTVPAD